MILYLKKLKFFYLYFNVEIHKRITIIFNTIFNISQANTLFIILRNVWTSLPPTGSVSSTRIILPMCVDYLPLGSFWRTDCVRRTNRGRSCTRGRWSRSVSSVDPVHPKGNYWLSRLRSQASSPRRSTAGTSSSRLGRI